MHAAEATTTVQGLGKAEGIEAVAAEAVRRAEAAGLYPALFQRPVNWEQVLAWAERVRQPGFAWRPTGRFDRDAIVVGPGPDGRTAVHAGQHRVLGGLLGGKPVPAESLCHISVEDPTRDWHDEAPALDALWDQCFATARR